MFPDQPVAMSNNNDEDYFGVGPNLGPKYTSTLKTSKSSQRLSEALPQFSSRQSPIQRNSKARTSTNSCPLSASSSQRAKERSRVPMMGQNALLAKTNNNDQNNDAASIIHSMVIDKFHRILNNYSIRSLQRRQRSSSSRNSGSTADCSSNLSSDADSCFSFLGSTDDMNRESSTEDLNTSSLVPATRDETEFDVSEFLNVAIGALEINAETRRNPQDEHNFRENIEQTRRRNPDCASLRFLRENHEQYRRSHEDDSVNTADLSLLMSRTTNDYNSLDRMASLAELDYEMDVYIENIRREIDVQDAVVNQILKALNFCKGTKEFMSSIEQVEAEKILLLASCRLEALHSELNYLEEHNDVDEQINYGRVEISEIVLACQQADAETERLKDFTEYYVLILSFGPKALASEVVTQLDDTIKFTKRFHFTHLPGHFKITLSVYHMRVKRNLRNYSHESKFHLNKKSKGACMSPKRFFAKTHKFKLLEATTGPRIQSSFGLWGRCELRMNDLSKTQLTLVDVPEGSNLLGEVSLKMSARLELKHTLSGFLTVATKDQGCPIWNRRWCVLRGHMLNYWNYPVEETMFHPIEEINLKDCLVDNIEMVDRSICAKVRTLLLPVRQKNYLLSADTPNDFSQWKTHLNWVLRSLIEWKRMNFYV